MKPLQLCQKGQLKLFLKTQVRWEVLLYHVASQNLMAKDVVNMSNITILEGLKLPVKITEQEVFVKNAKIIKTDVNASNEVIHAINTV
jgi:transforming growth factor-beta-induced protein